METFILILIATLINSLIGLIGVLTFFIKDKLLNKILSLFISLSAGALIGGAFFHLLDESIDVLTPTMTFIYAMIGFVLFLIIESYFHWHHCESCKRPYTKTMLIGDMFHNLIDGIVIAAAFSTNIFLGLITTLMVLAHEIPQEIGLFGVLLHGKYKKINALWLSFLAQSTCIIGGIIGYFLSSASEVLLKFLVPFAAGGFIYIAASDLVPEIHKEHKGKLEKTVLHLLIFLISLCLMLFLKSFESIH